MSLTNEEVAQLFALDKQPVVAATIEFPLQGEVVEIELQNETGRIRFQADINRANKIANKTTFQIRHRKIYSIRRLDLNGSHKNPPDNPPDSIFIGYENHVFLREDHIHFYFETFGERWALPLKMFPEIGISEDDQLFEKMQKFFAYCNVSDLKVRKMLEI